MKPIPPDPEPVRWQRWVQHEPSPTSVTVLVILWSVTLAAGAFALGLNCVDNAGNECGLTPVVTLGSMGLELVVLSPWVASWWARRGRDRRLVLRQQHLEPYLVQLRNWLAHGLLPVDAYRDHQTRIREALRPEAPGETRLSIAQFLRAWSALLAFGGILAIACVTIFFVEVVDPAILLPPVGLATAILVAACLLLTAAAGGTRAAALKRQREDLTRLEDDLEELAVGMAKPTMRSGRAR